MNDIWQGRDENCLQAAPPAAVRHWHSMYSGAQLLQGTKIHRLRAAFNEGKQVHLVSLRNLSDQIVVAEGRPLLGWIGQLWCQEKDSFPAEAGWSTRV